MNHLKNLASYRQYHATERANKRARRLQQPVIPADIPDGQSPMEAFAEADRAYRASLADYYQTHDILGRRIKVNPPVSYGEIKPLANSEGKPIRTTVIDEDLAADDEREADYRDYLDTKFAAQRGVL